MIIEANAIPAQRAGAAARIAAPTAALARDFEAMLLRPLVEAMLPESPAVFGEGPGAAVWRGELAAAVADAMARRGGIGIATGIGVGIGLADLDATTQPRGME